MYKHLFFSISLLILTLWTYAQTNTFPSSGSVGIGTTSPQQRLHVEGTLNQAIFVSTHSLGSGSGSGMIGYTKHLPTAAGNRLGYFLVGSRGGAQNGYNAAGMVGYAGGAWTAGASHPAYLAFETTPIGSTSRVERLRIASNGFVGIGVAVPEAQLHVLKANAVGAVGFVNAPLVVENSTHSYVNILAPDAAETGILFGKPASNISGGIIYNNASTVNGLQFRTHDNVNRMVLTSVGDLGVGTTLPDARMVVTDNTNVSYTASIENLYTGDVYSDGLNVTAGRNASAGSYFVSFRRPDGIHIGAVSQASANSVSYNTTSDKRLKANINETKFGLADVKKIQVKDYNFIGGKNVETGFLAQELYEIFPEAVAVGGDNPKERPWMVDYGRITPLLVKAVQELSIKTDEIDELKKELEELKQLVSKLANTQNIGSSAGSALLQNSPNPVRGSTSIKYFLPQGVDRAQMLITDALGRTIKTIQITASGSVNLDVSAISAGVYNYSLVVEGKTVETKKMTVVRN